MKNRLLKTFTSLVLTVLMVISVMPAFAITIGAEGKQTYVKVTTAPDDWSGTYLIVYEKGNVAFDGSLTTLDVDNNKVHVEISNGTITGDFSSKTFTIEKSGENYYTIQSKSGYYIGRTATSNGFDSSTSVAYTNTISLNNDGSVNIKSSGGPSLQVYVSGSNARFRYYKSSQKAIALYKLVEPTEGGSGSETTTETPSETETSTETETEVKGSGYEKVKLENIESNDTIIIVATMEDGSSFAISNDKGTAAPTAVSVTIKGDKITEDVADNILWNIVNNNGNLTIYPKGTTTTWLYCTNANNGVRVGINADNKVFQLDETTGYLKNTATSRYLGVYSSQDWRCYTSSTATNIKNQTFSFYKLVDANCAHSNKEEVAEVPATCTESGTTAGVRCADCELIISGCETIDATGHNFVNGKCAYNCGATRAVYTKVDDISTLVAGDVIVIYYPSGKLLLSGTASGTKLEGVSATVSNNTVISNNDDELVLIVGKDENGYVYFQTKDGKYLTSTGSNNLTLEDTLTDNAKWYFDTTGKTATLRIVNQNANNQALEYYKGFFTVYTIGDTAAYNFEVYRKAEPVIEGVGLSLNKGVTVKVRYTIPGSWLTANAGAKVVFSNDEKDIKTIDVVAGINVYAVDLTPAQINDALKVKITDEKGNLLVAEKDDVGVSAYKAKAEAAGASKQLIDLLNAALTYSSVADGTYDGKDLTNDFDGVADPTVVHKDDNAKLFEAFSGQLGTYASIYINVNTANVPDGETLVLKVGTGENERVIINGDNISKYITKDGQIVITGLFPANFDDTISIDTTIEGSMAEFTFNSYLKAIYDNSPDQSSVKNLAVATYLYGLAAEEYLKAQ